MRWTALLAVAGGVGGLAGLPGCHATVPEQGRVEGIKVALPESLATRAGGNASELRKAIEGPVGSDTLEQLKLAPEADLRTLRADFLKENATYAEKAWSESPWSGPIAEGGPGFRYVIPYATLNERRDQWRKDFYDRFHQKAWSYENPLDAVKWLNSDFQGIFGVSFHATKRPKPDQSPYESMEAHYASCTGMSILLTDACRAVGIPARIVGVPKWKGIDGNHNWVEVWGPVKQGEATVWSWHAVGEAGGDPRDLNWVHDRCKNHTDPDIAESRVYATVHRAADLHFPLVWDESITYVPAVNVTRFYLLPMEHAVTLAPGSRVEVRWNGETVVSATGSGPAKLPLAKGETFEIVTVDGRGQSTTTTVKL